MYLSILSLVKVSSVDSAEELVDAQDPAPFHSKRAVAMAATDAFAIDGQLPELEEEFVTYLRDTRLIGDSTEKNYKPKARQFLAFVEKLTKRPGRLEEAWNVNLSKKFFAELKKLYKPSSIMNHWATHRAIRDFLVTEGRCPENFEKINDTFDIQSKAGSRRRDQYLKQEKQLRLNDSEQLLQDIYIHIYHRQSYWEKLESLVDEIKTCIQEKKPIRRLTREEFCFVVGFLAWLLVIVNMKRSGNLALLKLDSTSSALNEALVAFREKNKDVQIAKLPRKIDLSTVVPAVFEVRESTKKKELEYFCVLNPRDQRWRGGVTL